MRRGNVFSWTFDGRRKFMLVMPLRMFSLLRMVRTFVLVEVRDCAYSPKSSNAVTEKRG